MKRIRVVNNKTQRSMVVTYDKGVIRLFFYYSLEPTIFKGTEEEFDNEWSNPDYYESGENEVYVI